MKTHRSPWRLLASLAVTGLLLAACGDDSDESTDEATPAADGGGSASTEEASATVAEFSSPPETIQVSEPVDADIPTGKTIYFITCGVEICELYRPILEEATELLDWDLEVISTDGSPESVASAWDQVVSDAPDAVLYTGTPRSQVEEQMTQAAANGTTIVGCCVVDPTDDVLDGVIYTSEEVGEQGGIMASWVVDDAAGTENPTPGVLYVDLPDFPILTELGVQYSETLTRLCPDCEQEVLPVGLADLGGLADQVVSALRANSNLKYVIVSTDSVSVGLPAAIAAAGLSDVKVFGSGPALATLQEIEAGERPGTIAFAAWENVFAMVDVVVRVEAGVDPASGYPPPNLILTEDNIEETDSLPKVVPDVVEQFAALWGKA